jgi:serine O-acetyltransferase
MTGEKFKSVIQQLSTMSVEEKTVIPCDIKQLPSVDVLRQVVSLVSDIVFPAYFNDKQGDPDFRNYHIGVNIERLSILLKEQIALALRFERNCDDDLRDTANKMMTDFMEALPELKRLLYTDVQAIFDNDPAVKNYSEVIFCYPVVKTMLHYRVAHQLHIMGVPILPRILTEQAHSATGIDIHPGAQIGEYFAIDHGTGVVIGETCIIGDHVTIYQGVTLGAKNFQIDDNGRPVNVPRHPIIGNHVTIYANSTILGRITIGENTVIGGNIWLTHSVPAGSRILQSKAVDVSFSGGLGI